MGQGVAPQAGVYATKIFRNSGAFELGTSTFSILAKAAQEEGAEQAASGMVYVELEKGSGPSPKASDKVKAHYHGTLIDGTVFDSSVDRGEPVIFPLTATDFGA